MKQENLLAYPAMVLTDRSRRVTRSNAVYVLDEGRVDVLESALGEAIDKTPLAPLRQTTIIRW